MRADHRPAAWHASYWDGAWKLGMCPDGNRAGDLFGAQMTPDHPTRARAVRCLDRDLGYTSRSVLLRIYAFILPQVPTPTSGIPAPKP